MNTRKQLSGKIFSNKMDKTVVVEVVKRFAHPIYKKYVNRTKKYYAHDPQNLCQIGDVVLIEDGFNVDDIAYTYKDDAEILEFENVVKYRQKSVMLQSVIDFYELDKEEEAVG